MQYSLKDKILIAMPIMDDPRFEKSVIYIFSHDESGCLGLIINKPSLLNFKDLKSSLNIKDNEIKATFPIYTGGPVKTNSGYIILREGNNIRVNASKEVLEAIVKGHVKIDKFKLVMGYTGWQPGQLEQELAQHMWLAVDRDDDIIFSHAGSYTDWKRSIKKVGIDITKLSSQTGNA